MLQFRRMCSLTAVDYEAGGFWVSVASLVVAVTVSVVSLRLAKVSVRIAESTLNLTKEVSERDLRDWTQRKWYDLYVAAEDFRLLLERFQIRYDRILETREFEDAAHELNFAVRRLLARAGIFPENPTVDAFFSWIRKWKLDENLFSKEMFEEFIDVVEGFRQKALVPEVVIS